MLVRQISPMIAIPSSEVSSTRVHFTSEDIKKLIEQLFKKGHRLSSLRRKAGGKSLEERVQGSAYVKIMLRRVLHEMGDQRRLGNHLRGLSSLLMEQIENYIWETVVIESKLCKVTSESECLQIAIKECLSK